MRLTPDLSDYWRLMRMPLPVCVLSFATLAAALSPRIYLDRLLLTYLGIFAGLSLASYSFDELRGRPLRTKIADKKLWLIGGVGYFSGIVTGAFLILTVSYWLLPLLVAVAFFVAAYNLELFGGRFHNAPSFAVSWGGLTAFGSYYLHALTVNAISILVAAAASAFSLALWILTHEIVPQLDIIVSESDNRFREERRKVRRIIWKIIKVQSAMTFFLALTLLAFRLTS